MSTSSLLAAQQCTKQAKAGYRNCPYLDCRVGKGHVGGGKDGPCCIGREGQLSSLKGGQGTQQLHRGKISTIGMAFGVPLLHCGF
jgi:hypothetical protein